MESPFSKFVLPAPDIVWRPALESGAGVYLVGTDLHFVTPGSAREMELADAGALRVGTLRFDGDPLERAHACRAVRAIDPRPLARAEQSRN